MSNIKIANINTNNYNNKEDKFTNIEFIIPKNLRINNNNENQKSFKLEESQNEIMIPKIKLNYRIRDLNHNYYFNKNNKRKINNIIDSPNKYYIGNYKNMITSPLSPKINNSVKFANKLINNMHNFHKFLNNKSKVILPRINMRNKKALENQKNEKEKSLNKKISVGYLLKNKYHYDNFSKNNQNLLNSSSHSKSDWHLITENRPENNKDDINLEDLFNKNYGKYSDIINEVDNKNVKIEKKLKNGAERLKEIHKQKLIDCSMKIKKTAKETEHKKEYLNKYILLMRQNFENSAEFNVNFF